MITRERLVLSPFGGSRNGGRENHRGPLFSTGAKAPPTGAMLRLAGRPLLGF